MNDLTIAISVDQEFDDVKILVDLIRKNWSGHFSIVVCTALKNAETHLKDCNIDTLLNTESIPQDLPSLTDQQLKLHSTLQMVSNLRKVCHYSTSLDAPYTLHLHAGSFPFSWEVIKKMITTMNDQGKYFAARGEGFGFYTPDKPMGSFDSSFILFSNTFARTQHLWEFNLFDFLPHKVSINGLIALLVLTRVGIRRFWHYTHHTQSANWNDEATMSNSQHIKKPMSFDPEKKFLEIDSRAFPHPLDLQLKAYYLKTEDILQGDFIGKLLNQWTKEIPILQDHLKTLEENYDNFFKTKGLLSSIYGKNFVLMQKLIDEYKTLSHLKKCFWLLKMHLSQIKMLFLKRMERKLRVHRWTCVYSDEVWPQSLKKFYCQLLHPDIKNIPELHQLPFR